MAAGQSACQLSEIIIQSTCMHSWNRPTSHALLSDFPADMSTLTRQMLTPWLPGATRYNSWDWYLLEALIRHMRDRKKAGAGRKR